MIGVPKTLDDAKISGLDPLQSSSRRIVESRPVALPCQIALFHFASLCRVPLTPALNFGWKSCRLIYSYISRALVLRNSVRNLIGIANYQNKHQQRCNQYHMANTFIGFVAWFCRLAKLANALTDRHLYLSADLNSAGF